MSQSDIIVQLIHQLSISNSTSTPHRYNQHISKNTKYCT